MQDMQIQQAAAYLLARRRAKQPGLRLAPGLQPQSIEQAFAIQRAVMDGMDDTVGGWKCLLPNGEKLIAAPIFSKSIYSRSPCAIELDQGKCRIEPEIAFCFKQDMPARETEYAEQDVLDALGSAHMALELIINRHLPDEKAGFLENVADCLFNQGLFIGPEIALPTAFTASSFVIHISQTLDDAPPLQLEFAAKHPNQFPHLPLLWLVNFLSQRGIDIKAGQAIITGSYAGVIEVQANLACRLEYQGLGCMEVVLQSR
jgi:2-keto-4-pentenoate hydratase